jgi:outer membrane protein assembly factor BamB
LDGRVQLVSPGAKACYGYDADTGKELWKITYDGYSNAASPVFLKDKMAIINTGFGKAHLLGVRLDGELKGDVTRTHVEWDVFKRIPTLSSPLVVEGKIYVVSEIGIVSRIDAASGKIEASLPLGGRYSSSAAHADGHLYFLSEEGETKVVRPGPKMELVATNPLDDGFMASPAFDGDSLYLRTKSHVYRIGKKP